MIISQPPWYKFRWLFLCHYNYYSHTCKHKIILNFPPFSISQSHQELLLISVNLLLSSFQFQFSCSVMSDSCNPIDYSTAGFSVHHQLPDLAQIHVQWVSDAIQPSHPLSSPSPPAPIPPSISLFQWVNSSHEVAKVLALQPQLQSFHWIFGVDFL